MRVSGQVLSYVVVLLCCVARGERSSSHPHRGLSWLSKPGASERSRPSSAAVVAAAALHSSTPSLPPPPPPSSSSTQREPPESSKKCSSTDEHASALGPATTPSTIVAATIGTASTATRFLVQHLPSSSVSNVTRALLPLAPFIVEAPALTAHARAAWPWARAALTTAVSMQRRPFGFVASPPSFLPHHNQQLQQRQQQGQHQQQLGEGARDRKFRSRRRSRRTRHEGEREAHEPSSAPETRRVGNTSPISSFSPKYQRENSNDTPVSLTRRGAVRETLTSVTRWCAAGAAAVSLARNGPLVACADDGESWKRAKRGGSMDGDETSTGQFGSKAFTKQSYDGFAEGYDDLDGGWAASALGTEEQRSQLLSRATGRVLEVGVGTGLNLRHYRRDLVSAIDAVDLSPGMLSQAASRSGSLGMKDLVKLAVMDVERLGFPSDSFDTVVDTFSLCVFSNPSAALREMARVCKPGGRVLLLENSKSEFGPLAAYQDITASYLAEKGGGKGCFWNQDVEGLCRGAGLQVVRSSPALVGGLFRTLECVPAKV